jgi:hypothetical protein
MTTQGGKREWLDRKLSDQATFDQSPDRAALDRILEAIQEHVPANLDKDRLLSHLRKTVQLYAAGLMMRNRPAKQSQRGNRIVKKAREIKALLEQNPPLILELRIIYYRQLDDLIAKIEYFRRFAAQYGNRLGLGERSAFEHLIFQWHQMFKTHFGIKHRYTKRPDSHEVEGLFIDFAEAALKELGINNSGNPYSRRAIADALTNRQNRAEMIGIGG